MKNLSDRELNRSEQQVLAKGLNFAITPQHVPIVELITKGTPLGPFVFTEKKTLAVP